MAARRRALALVHPQAERPGDEPHHASHHSFPGPETAHINVASGSPGGISPPGPLRTTRARLRACGLPLNQPRPLFASSVPVPAGSSRLPGCPAEPCRLRWPLRSGPVTGLSSLLQATPPLCAASVLSPSRFCCLRFSLLISTTGSQVPHESPDRLPATCMPDADRAVNRHPPTLSRSNDFPPVLTSFLRFRHFISGSLAFGSTIHT